MRQLIAAAAVAGAAADTALAQPAIPEIRVVGRALTPGANETLFQSTAVDRAALARSAGLRLDDVLRAVPGFGLFRRQSSRAAHPTTQGVTLRGLGASGAGRTLVLLDGVPQNDAFGGWIDWSRMPSALIERATVTRGGGAGAWGNAALAGVVRLESRWPDPGRGAVEARGGTDDTLSGAAAGSVAVGGAVLSASAFGHDTGGGFLIRRDQRGPVDRRAANSGGGGALAVTGPVAESTRLTLRAAYSEDRLTNGLDAARSRARVADASASLVNDAGPGATAWQVNAYVRDQAFRAVFAGVNAARTAATPALDQFAVPASAAGANAVVRWPLSAALTLELGGDVRHADGATNERFQFVGQGFTRRRVAGGEQTLAGGFVEATWTPQPAVLLSLGGRLDAWRQHGGSRRETDIATGATLRDDRFAARDGVVGNFRAGTRVTLAEAVAVRAVAYSGFRVPTLNELYRPFRVGNDITEANPALAPERLYGGDLGFDWQLGPDLALGATYFHARLSDAVTNITVRTAPGPDPGLGVFVPAGGVLRQRRNLDRIAADGVEADVRWTAAETLGITVRYLFTDPTVRRSADQPGLVGNRLAQVARHQGTLALAWQPAPRLTVDAQLRAASRQFDDDQNARVLRGYVVADVSAGYMLTERVQLFLAAENLFDRTIETGRSADGLISVGQRRQFAGGVKLAF